MEKNKKKKVIHSILVATVVTSGVATAASLLSSCNLDISRGGPQVEQDIQEETGIKNPGYSNFIDNIDKNDIKQLDKLAKLDLVPKQTKTKPKGSGNIVKFTKSHFMSTKDYKDVVSQNRAKLYDICQQYTMNKINSIFEDDKNNYNIFANVAKKGDSCTIAYQISKKPFEDFGEDITDENLKSTRSTDNDTMSKPLPFIAFKYTFDLKRIKFDINDDGFLVVSGIENKSEYDLNGDVQSMPQDMLIDLNNNQDIFNTRFENIKLESDTFKPFREWNKEKINNSSFLATSVAEMRKSAQNRIENIRWFGSSLFSILEKVKENPMLADLILSLNDFITDALSRLGMNQKIVDVAKFLLNQNTKVGGPKYSNNTNTLYGKLISLIKSTGAHLIDWKLLGSIDTLFKNVNPDEQPIYWLFELPNKLSKLTQDQIDTTLKGLSKNLKKLFGTLKTKIEKVYAKAMAIGKFCPENNIGKTRVLDVIWGDDFVKLYKPKIESIIKSKFSGKKLKALGDVLRQFSFNTNIIGDIINDFMYVTADYDDTIFSKWPKPDFDKKFPISEYFQKYTNFSVVSEKFSPNSDGQSFSIDATYRLNFNKKVFFELTQWHNIMNNVNVKEVLKIVGGPKIGALIKFYKLMPDFLTITEGDYIEFRIKDDKAFVLPTNKGYKIKAKQDFQVNFKKTNDSIFFDILQDIPLILEDFVEGKLNPFETTIDNYYLSARMPKNFVKDIKSSEPVMNIKEYVYDGTEIDPSSTNIDAIKSIISKYVKDHVSSINSSLNFVGDIDNVTKDQILKQLGLDPNLFRDKAKFILSMKPGFDMKASTNNAPTMSNINLDISFNVPIINKKGEKATTNKWTNNIEIKNIKI